ncbi:polysaccharide biosynthesis protein [Aliidiomarina maris]|nr:polysaccharide biosynthesis protein [Aliidiomarina maris]
MDILGLIGRNQGLFDSDINAHSKQLIDLVGSNRFLVIGGAGSIGHAVTKEIFKRHPLKLHVVDISENNLVELVRDIRSSLGYIEGDFRTFALDVGSLEYQAFLQQEGGYDYVLNLSALKHVRSEKDPFTLMRMLETNIFNTEKTLNQAIMGDARKYFCVSTDKAANPVNMMGASKRIMEMFLMRGSQHIDISTARFANVAFSDGSLLHGFNQRIQKRQPIVAPKDIKRYFLTPEESGQLCLMSCMLGDNRDILFPKLSAKLHLTTFAEIAERYLNALGLEVAVCQTETQARQLMATLPQNNQWPCLFTDSDTTGEKDFEEFFTAQETLDMRWFESIGVVKSALNFDTEQLDVFAQRIAQMRTNLAWSKQDILDQIQILLPEFQHQEKGRYLDDKM